MVISRTTPGSVTRTLPGVSVQSLCAMREQYTVWMMLDGDVRGGIG